jgi:hypothetical protein
VMNPAKGENITVWAKREADYRSGKRAAAKPVRKGPDKGDLVKPLLGQLAAISLTQAVYAAIVSVADQGVVIVTPKGGGEPIALAIAPLKGMTADKAVTKPVESEPRSKRPSQNHGRKRPVLLLKIIRIGEP